MKRARTPAAFAVAIVGAYRRRQLEPDPALAEAGLAPAELEVFDGRITADQLEVLSGRAMRELDDEALGWFSRRLPWGSYGMLCRASLTAPHLGVAIARWCRHHGLLTDDVRLSLRRGEGVAEIAIDEAVALGPMREFCLVSLLRNVLGVACWLADTRISLIDVALPFDPPPHHDAYPLMFDGAIRFGAARAGLRFNADYLALPVLRDDVALRDMLARPLPLMVRHYRRDRMLAREVTRLVGEEPSADADRIAFRLSLSVRSLHRHLSAEGTTFQALKDHARQRLAEALLATTPLALKQVAQRCGFSAEASFVRAFHSWTGLTPHSYRRAVQRP
jgi:AraC-like DNA-binding protein